MRCTGRGPWWGRRWTSRCPGRRGGRGPAGVGPGLGRMAALVGPAAPLALNLRRALQSRPLQAYRPQRRWLALVHSLRTTVSLSARTATTSRLVYPKEHCKYSREILRAFGFSKVNLLTVGMPPIILVRHPLST